MPIIEVDLTGAIGEETVTAYKPLHFPDHLGAELNTILEAIDEQAWNIGMTIKASSPSPQDLRKRAAAYQKQKLFWLVSTDLALADALERDVRFAALPALLTDKGNVNKDIVPLYARFLNSFL